MALQFSVTAVGIMILQAYLNGFGSAVIAAVKFAGGTINIAVGLMAIFFFLGFVLLRVADKKESSRG